MRALILVNGVPRMQDLSASSIYDDYISIVSGTPANGNQLQGPVTSGTSITLPNSGTYTGNELQVYLNGSRVEKVVDYTWLGSGTRTQISFTFDLQINDRVRFIV